MARTFGLFQRSVSGFRSPTSADCLQSPRAGGRVIATIRLAGAAEELAFLSSDRRSELMKSKIVGSAVGLLLFFSALCCSRTFIQDPKPVSQTTRQAETSNQQTDSQPTRTNTSAETKLRGGRAAETSASAASLSAATEKAAISSDSPSPSHEVIAVPAQAYMATAYSLRGRTSSGRPASRGLIAADPSVLPLGTRVRLEAGAFSGEYVVGDTGGAVRGRRIDIWTPTANEAQRFGRRVVKLTVLSFGAKRARSAKRSRPTTSSTTTQSANKQEK